MRLCFLNISKEKKIARGVPESTNSFANKQSFFNSIHNTRFNTTMYFQATRVCKYIYQPKNAAVVCKYFLSRNVTYSQILFLYHPTNKRMYSPFHFSSIKPKTSLHSQFCFAPSKPKFNPLFSHKINKNSTLHPQFSCDTK